MKQKDHVFLTNQKRIKIAFCISICLLIFIEKKIKKEKLFKSIYVNEGL